MSKSMPTTQQAVTGKDREILRDLARRIAEIAALPVMDQRKALWRRHNSLDRPRAMILVFPEGSWRELLTDADLTCESAEARGIEYGLRTQIYTHEHFDSDNVITADVFVQKKVDSTGWGIGAEWTHSDDPTGARAFKPVIHEAADLKKITAPTVTYNEPATLEAIDFNQDLFGDILNVRLSGIKGVSYHLMNQYTALRGLAEAMMDMVMNPGMLHEAMSILEDGHRGVLRQYVEQDLLDVNNDNAYTGTGGCGWTDELPAEGFDPDHVRPCDMWSSAEAQELAQVSPEMHQEFSMQYEKRLLEPFGLTCYGCCEDLTRKLDDVLEIPHIRRISISPWADVPTCAEKIGRRACLNWKPHPAHLCGKFDPDRIRQYLQDAVEASKDCCIDMVLKDTHTCDHQPQRFDQWCKIAREVVNEHGSP